MEDKVYFLLCSRKDYRFLMDFMKVLARAKLAQHITVNGTSISMEEVKKRFHTIDIKQSTFKSKKQLFNRVTKDNFIREVRVIVHAKQ